jgi:Na+-transporting NADH:ubiquinone oxidoreductase subunit NqrC
MNKKRIFFVITLVIMVFVTSSGILLNGIQQRNASLHRIQKIYPESSAPHSKIYIDGNNA